MNSTSTSRKSLLNLSILDDLNDEQREAVLAAPGPMLVLAGAGTGKTRVIACRIAALLESDPSLQPENILALTFSRKAAQEMLDRVEALRGGYADELGAFTFHSFCHRFLQDHALACGLPDRFRLLDSVDAWIFFRGLLREMNLRHTWNLADPTACIHGFLRFIGRAKDELVSPEEYSGFAAGQGDADGWSRAEEIARAYRCYQDALRRSGQMDFGDLIVRTVEALRKNPSLLKQTQDRYRTILVDEFQDTNVAQIELLKLLAGPEPNLCVVGDDDQAIYRFRGASFASFLLLQQAYPSSRVIRLTRNYRSTPSILSAAERLIRHNEPDRYDPQKKLSSVLPEGVPVDAFICQDGEHEAEQAVSLLRRLWASRPVSERRWGRMAVLYRAHAHREILVRHLRRAGIPFSVRGGYSLFDQPEVRDLLAFLRLLQDPSDPIPLFRLMSHPALGIPVEDLLRLTRWARERELPLRQVMDALPADAAWTPAMQAGVERLRADLRALSAGGDLETLVLGVAEKSFLRLLFRQGEEPLVALGSLLRWVRRFLQTEPDRADLPSFLWYLEGAMKAGVTESLPEEEVGVSEDRISLMTVHQAKGLEFDEVLLLGMTQGQFPARNRPEPIPFPVDLMKERLPQGDYHLQEERRLCYVACTRARRELILLTQDRTRKRPSVFLREMTGDGPAGLRLRPAEPSAVPRAGGTALPVSSLGQERELLRLAAEIRTLPVEDEEGFGKRLQALTALAVSLRSQGAPVLPEGEGFKTMAWPVGDRFSYTQLETYRSCPLRYLYAYLYRIPARSAPYMLFGIDLHECLERLYRQVMEGRIPPREELLDFFRRFQKPGRYGESGEDSEYRRLGEQLLADFYRRQEGRWVPPLEVEKSFCLRLEEISIQGVIDRIDRLPEGGVRILDYKSGKPKEKADFEEQLQLWLYALAAREVLALDPVRVSFYYLRTNAELSFDRVPGTLEQTRDQILLRAREIRKGQFIPTPSVTVCGRCDYRNLCPSSAV